MPRHVLPPLVALLLALVSSPPTCGPRASAGESAAIGAVRRLLESEDPSGRAAAIRRLAGVEDRAAERLLLDTLDDPHPYVRRAAAGVLAAAPPTASARAVTRRVEALRALRSPRARAAATRIFALRADEAGRDGLLAALGDREAQVRAAALRWLADPDLLGPAAESLVRPALEARLEDRDGEVRALALDALAARPGVNPPSPALLADPDPRVRLSALEATAVRFKDTARAATAVLHGLEDAVWSVRLRAAEVAGAVPDRRLLPALIRALVDGRRRVAEAAHGALVLLTGIPFDPDPEVWGRWLATDGADFDPAIPTEAPARPRPPDPGRTIALPRFLGLPLVSRHLGFVLDASGSMKRAVGATSTRWGRACAELEAALAALDGAASGSRVNVWVFRETVEALYPKPVRPTVARRDEIRARLAALVPGGRTALFDGIAAALADEDVDSVVVLSDGAPSAGAFFTKTDLLLEVARCNRWRRARIDVVSIGGDQVAARWRTGLREMAEATGGTWLAR